MNTRTFVRLTGVTGLAIALPLLAADRLAIKTGLWENTVTTQMSGVQLPTEELARLPAAQRAQMEQMLRQMGIGAPSTTTERSCLTEDDRDPDNFRRQFEQDSEDCTYQEVTNTSRRQEWTFQCSADGQAATGRMVMEVVNDSQVRGTMEVRSPQGNMDMKFEARWIQTSCAGATN